MHRRQCLPFHSQGRGPQEDQWSVPRWSHLGSSATCAYLLDHRRSPSRIIYADFWSRPCHSDWNYQRAPKTGTALLHGLHVHGSTSSLVRMETGTTHITWSSAFSAVNKNACYDVNGRPFQRFRQSRAILAE